MSLCMCWLEYTNNDCALNNLDVGKLSQGKFTVSEIHDNHETFLVQDGGGFHENVKVNMAIHTYLIRTMPSWGGTYALSTVNTVYRMSRMAVIIIIIILPNIGFALHSSFDLNVIHRVMHRLKDGIHDSAKIFCTLLSLSTSGYRTVTALSRWSARGCLFFLTTLQSNDVFILICCVPSNTPPPPKHTHTHPVRIHLNNKSLHMIYN